MTKTILLDSLLQEDRVLAPQGPSSISAVAELVLKQRLESNWRLQNPKIKLNLCNLLQTLHVDDITLLVTLYFAGSFNPNGPTGPNG